MSAHYPQIRILEENGHIRVREGLRLTYYIRRPHPEIAQAVLRSLDLYLASVGLEALGLYASEEGEWRELDEGGWSLIRRELQAGSCPLITLKERGPEWVRELAIEFARLLPLCSGSCGLSLNGELDMPGVPRALAPYWMRYPGIDLPSPHGHSRDIGTRIRGPHWVNFLGQPVLGELGGPKGLRDRLRSPGITVQELAGDKAVITLGQWPEAGDTERGEVLPAYRELARVLEPWLYHRRVRMLRRSEEETRRWERRFLD